MDKTKILYIPKFMFLLKHLTQTNPKTASDLFIETDCAYSYLLKMRKIFVEQGWITTKKEGTQINMLLTEKGVDVVEAINYLLQKIEMEEPIFRMRKKKKGKVVFNHKEFKEAVEEAKPNDVIIYDEGGKAKPKGGLFEFENVNN